MPLNCQMIEINKGTKQHDHMPFFLLRNSISLCQKFTFILFTLTYRFVMLQHIPRSLNCNLDISFEFPVRLAGYGNLQHVHPSSDCQVQSWPGLNISLP